MAIKPKKPVETIASLKAEIKQREISYNVCLNFNRTLTKENESLKNSFSMLKANFEREKNRLDKVIDSLLNVTKTK